VAAAGGAVNKLLGFICNGRYLFFHGMNLLGKDHMLITATEDIRRTIGEIIAGSDDDRTILIAVAFWGDGAESLLPTGKRYKVICNLSKGGTNPSMIRKLMMYPGIEVKHSPSLHAKVLVGQTGCLIGSANFSSSAIGFNSVPTWQEVDVFLPSSDARFDETQDWFWDQWRNAFRIREPDLRNAEQQWSLRKRLWDELSDHSSSSVELNGSKYVLTESDLFKPVITGQNQIRMASTSMETLFHRLEPNPGKTMIRVPAFVSNILWTFYGQAISTKIPERLEFQLPAHVWERALGKGQPKYNESKIHAFLSLLSTHPDSTAAIRYWATSYIEQGSPGAP
jgi:hypothetical protein